MAQREHELYAAVGAQSSRQVGSTSLAVLPPQHSSSSFPLPISTKLQSTHLHAAALCISHVHIPPLPLAAGAPLAPPAAAAAAAAAAAVTLLPLLLDDCIQIAPLLAAALAFPALCRLPTVVMLPAGRAGATTPHFVASPAAAALLVLSSLLPALRPLLLLLLPPTALPPAAALLATARAQPQAAGGHSLRRLHILDCRDAEDERDGRAGLGNRRRGTGLGLETKVQNGSLCMFQRTANRKLQNPTAKHSAAGNTAGGTTPLGSKLCKPLLQCIVALSSPYRPCPPTLTESSPCASPLPHQLSNALPA